MRLLFVFFSIAFLSTPAFSYTPPALPDVQADAARLLARPPASLQRETALGCMAVAVYHESRGEPLDGQLAVGSVIISRSLDHRWPSHPCDVVRQPSQFSFMTSLVDFPPIRSGKSWETSVRIAAKSLLVGPLPELSGADHYHADYVSPSWSKKMRLVQKRGVHLFFVSK